MTRRLKAPLRGAGIVLALGLATLPLVLPANTASAQVISSKKEQAIFETPFGKIVMEFYEDTAPKHVAAFKKNVRTGIYDRTSIFKIVPGFVIMGGDPFTRDDSPANDGWGGFGPPIPNEFSAAHKNVRGAVGAPRKPDGVNPDKAGNGFQFYIALADLPSLDASEHTVFGRVVAGMDVVDRIAGMTRDDKGAPKDRVEFKKVSLERR